MSSSPISKPRRKSTSAQTSPHLHQPIPISPPKSATIEPSFICTICWQPQYPPPIPSSSKSRFGPKLLGTSARIVCQACWCAVLDLSICWVCGECIVRGDEVVSLGWCFWHRGCFGCLICGTKIAPPSHNGESAPQRKWRSCDGSDDGVGQSKKRKRCAGVELEEIPLCSACEIETGGESQNILLGKGLETVSKVDGGLSRNRLERFSEQQAELKVVPRRLARRPRRVQGATGIESELGRFINRSSTTSRNASESRLIEDRTPLLLQAADFKISEDGASDHFSDEQDSQVTHTDDHSTEHAPTVYVSIFDPIGDPPFTPSPTKPLPTWMSLLPNNVRKSKEKRERQQRDASPESRLSHEFTNEDHSNQSSSGESSSTDSSGSYDGLRSAHNLTPLGPARGSDTVSEEGTLPIDIPGPKRRARTSISFKGDEFDTKSRSSRRSQTINTTYSTPPEFSTKPPQYRRYPTPFPRIPRPGLEREDSSSYFMHSVNTGSRIAHSQETVAGMMTLSHFQEMSCSSTTSTKSNTIPPFIFTSPPMAASTEYLDRYQPKSLAGLHQKYVAKKPQPIMEKLKRQRSEKDSTTQTSRETSKFKKGTLVAARSKDEEAGFDLKREDLKNELKDLFCAK